MEYAISWGMEADMARALWKGNINFGLVNIPVELFPGENSEDDVTFRLLDRRTMSPIKNERVNEENGKKVPWEEVVKGYEYEKNKFVIVTDQDFKEANVEATQSIDILDFVETSEIHPMYFDKPYFLAPAKGGDRVYALLRDTLKKSGRVGIANVVIRTRQHLAAVMARDEALILETLRFANELRAVEDLKLPREAGAVRKNEIELAEKLVEGMTSKWDPEKYHDVYHDDLLKLIRKKVKAGRTEEVEPAHPAPAEKRNKAKVVDVMDLLQKSLEQRGSRHKADTKPAREKKSA